MLHRVLGIVRHRQIDAEIGGQRIDEAVDRPGAAAFDPLGLAIVGDLRRDNPDPLVVGVRVGVVIDKAEPRARLVDIESP
jgi:hypothetical protein